MLLNFHGLEVGTSDHIIFGYPSLSRYLLFFSINPNLKLPFLSSTFHLFQV